MNYYTTSRRGWETPLEARGLLELRWALPWLRSHEERTRSAMIQLRDSCAFVCIRGPKPFPCPEEYFGFRVIPGDLSLRVSGSGTKVIRPRMNTNQHEWLDHGTDLGHHRLPAASATNGFWQSGFGGAVSHLNLRFGLRLPSSTLFSGAAANGTYSS